MVPCMEACGQYGVLGLGGVFPDHPPNLTITVELQEARNGCCGLEIVVLLAIFLLDSHTFNILYAPFHRVWITVVCLFYFDLVIFNFFILCARLFYVCLSVPCACSAHG